MSADSFAQRLLGWFDLHGRHDLPWQHPRTPYRVWLSEIMLQQTQVATVIPYFLRFVDRFPTLPDLAAATTDHVMAHWAGLGYYARARNLHAAAKTCVANHDGDLPRDFDALHALPGAVVERSILLHVEAVAQGVDRHHDIVDVTPPHALLPAPLRLFRRAPGLARRTDGMEAFEGGHGDDGMEYRGPHYTSGSVASRALSSSRQRGENGATSPA